MKLSRSGCVLVPSILALLVACGDNPPPQPVTPPAPSASTAPMPSASAPTDPVPSATATAATTPPAPPPSSDPVDVAPNNYKKIFENDQVRVLEITMKAGDKVAKHKHPDHVAYVISGGKMKMAAGDAPAQEMDMKAGQAVFLPAQEHSAENTGTTEIKAVVVELKMKGYTAAPKGGDPTKVGAGTYKQVLDNDRVRVLEVTVKPGAKVGEHAHPDHAVYILTAGKMKFTSGKEAHELEGTAGQTMFLPAQLHSSANVGKTELKAVIFELKPAK